MSSGKHGGGRGGGAAAKRRKPDPADRSALEREVFISNCPMEITDEMVREFYSDLGEQCITRIHWLFKDRQFRGCGFLEFRDAFTAALAVERGGPVVGGQHCVVKLSKDHKPGTAAAAGAATTTTTGSAAEGSVEGEAATGDVILAKERVPEANLRTVSVALPCSVLSTQQKRILKCTVLGQLARTVATFRVDEFILFSEDGSTCTEEEVFSFTDTTASGSDGEGGTPDLLLGARLLSYMECPQYLRKFLFPVHRDFQQAGLLPPLAIPSHMSKFVKSPFREGVVTADSGDGHYQVNVGLHVPIPVTSKKPLQENQRVTVEFADRRGPGSGTGPGSGAKVVSRRAPFACGIYWGYSVRTACGLAEALDSGPWGKYDAVIGTADTGENIYAEGYQFPEYKHLLIVLGGPEGLEFSINCDKRLAGMEPKKLFHQYINVCPNQGTRTIRTEDALTICLSALQPFLARK